MSITVSPSRDPNQHEGPIHTGPDRYEVREQIRGTHTTVAVHERFSRPGPAAEYAAQRTEQEPAMYGSAAAHELVVTDTRGWLR